MDVAFFRIEKPKDFLLRAYNQPHLNTQPLVCTFGYDILFCLESHLSSMNISSILRGEQNRSTYRSGLHQSPLKARPPWGQWSSWKTRQMLPSTSGFQRGLLSAVATSLSSQACKYLFTHHFWGNGGENVQIITPFSYLCYYGYTWKMNIINCSFGRESVSMLSAERQISWRIVFSESHKKA